MEYCPKWKPIGYQEKNLQQPCRVRVRHLKEQDGIQLE